MKKRIKYPRKSDKDVFLAKKLKSANFKTGFYQVPAIRNQQIIKPDDLVVWSLRKRCTSKSKCGLVFYEFDGNFDDYDGIYMILKYGSDSDVQNLISELKEFAFVVCPDYSVYGNFPNYKQIDALSRSREVGYILSTYGVKVIINYRATYDWTYELALSGMENHQTVTIGTLGALRDNKSRKMLKDSIDVLVKYIDPHIIIVYGKVPNDVFKAAIDRNIDIWQFDSMISRAFSEDNNNGNEG